MNNNHFPPPRYPGRGYTPPSPPPAYSSGLDNNTRNLQGRSVAPQRPIGGTYPANQASSLSAPTPVLPPNPRDAIVRALIERLHKRQQSEYPKSTIDALYETRGISSTLNENFVYVPGSLVSDFQDFRSARERASRQTASPQSVALPPHVNSAVGQRAAEGAEQQHILVLNTQEGDGVSTYYEITLPPGTIVCEDGALILPDGTRVEPEPTA